MPPPSFSSSSRLIQLEVVAAQGTKYRAPNKVRDGGFLGSEVMSEKQLYPVYDRLVSKVGEDESDRSMGRPRSVL